MIPPAIPLPAVIALAVLLVLLHFLGKYLYQYRIGEESIQIRLFCLIPIFTIAFKNITEVRKITFGEALWKVFTLKWVNRIYSKEYVLIRWKGRIFSAIIISPKNTDAFVLEVLGKMR